MNINANTISLTLLPFVTAAVKQNEAHAIAGKDKLAAVMSYVQGVYEGTSGPTAFGIAFECMESIIKGFVAAVVQHYNETGVFTKQQLLSA